MRKIILTFGLIAGFISSAMMGLTIPFADKLGHNGAAYLLGYTTLVLSFLLVYFGIRQARDNPPANAPGNPQPGTITFTRAFTVGLAITVVASLCYVLTWEVLYYTVFPDFMDKYAAHLIQKAQHANLSPAALQAQLQQIQHQKALYRNPLYNAALTFLEPFPVGLVVTLISAVILRRKTSPQPAPTSLAESF